MVRGGGGGDGDARTGPDRTDGMGPAHSRGNHYGSYATADAPAPSAAYQPNPNPACASGEGTVKAAAGNVEHGHFPVFSSDSATADGFVKTWPWRWNRGNDAGEGRAIGHPVQGQSGQGIQCGAQAAFDFDTQTVAK